MQFEEGQGSRNIEDRRGMRPRMGMGGMGGRVGGVGIGGLIILLAISYFLTGDPTALLDGGAGVPGEPAGMSAPTGVPAASDEAATFVSNVLGDTERTWDQLFAASNRRYQQPTLVLFTDAVDSACGMTSSAVGPFYCPGDQKVYIDLGFYRDLDRQFGAPGDFAQAYVIAHEVGHHVQNLLGQFERAARLRSDGAPANAVSVQQELQADCLAGVWGHYAAQRGRLEAGDLEEGLNAAAAIGDDRIQKRTRRSRPSPGRTGPRQTASSGSNAASTPGSSRPATPSVSKPHAAARSSDRTVKR